ncbi:MAG: hypothetical protein ACOYZ7_08500 [Chloroflexota bacterium]
MNEQSERPQHLFIVRIWQERSQVAPDRWRGSVEHVPSAQRLYFTSLGDLTDFIILSLNNPVSAGQDPQTKKGVMG